MDNRRHSRPDRPHRRHHRRQHRPGLRDGGRTRRQGGARRARRAQPRQGHRRRAPYRAVQPRCEGRTAGARPDLAGFRSHRRRPVEVEPSLHRPADQQRRRHVHCEVEHQGRLRIAVRHKPSGPLRVHRPAPRPRARIARVTRGHGEQRRTSFRQRNPVRKPPMGTGLQPGSCIRPVQARQPDVHL